MANFQYDPPTGPISGVSFEDQTELAINDLHDRIDETNTNTSEAKDTADQALASASEAKQAAAQAQTSADEAKTQITQVRNDLTATTTVANNAMTRANNAFDLAATAQGQASQATTGLSNHIADHNNPHAVTAEQAGAYTIAETEYRIGSLVPLIDAAMGTFRIETEDVDIDTFYYGANKIYLTGSGTTPLPPNITIPAWLMVYINEDDTAATQRLWDSSNTHLIYERTGKINNSDPENPVVTWTPWNTIASPTVVKSVTVEVDPAGQPAGTYLVFVMETSSGDVTTYVNLSQVTGGGYSSGNGAIDISSDNKISLQLDPNNSTGLNVSANGLQALPAISATNADPTTGRSGSLYPDGVTITQTAGGMLSVPGGGGDVAAAIAAHDANVDAHAALFGVKIRRRLAADTTLYVRKDGNDSNDGLSSSTAFLTISRVIEELRRIDGCGFTVSLRLGEGEWGSMIFDSGMLIGASLFRILGVAGLTTINANQDYGLYIRGQYRVDVWHVSIQNSTTAVLSREGASVSLNNVNLAGASETDLLIRAQAKGKVILGGNIGVSGMASSFVYALDGTVEFWETNVSLVGNPQITSFFNLHHSFLIFDSSTTFAGSSVGRKYYMVAGSILQTSGQGDAVIPGESVTSLKDASCFVI